MHYMRLYIAMMHHHMLSFTVNHLIRIQSDLINIMCESRVGHEIISSSLSADWINGTSRILAESLDQCVTWHIRRTFILWNSDPEGNRSNQYRSGTANPKFRCRSKTPDNWRYNDSGLFHPVPRLSLSILHGYSMVGHSFTIGTGDLATRQW